MMGAKSDIFAGATFYVNGEKVGKIESGAAEVQYDETAHTLPSFVLPNISFTLSKVKLSEEFVLAMKIMAYQQKLYEDTIKAEARRAVQKYKKERFLNDKLRSLQR